MRRTHESSDLSRRDLLGAVAAAGGAVCLGLSGAVWAADNAAAPAGGTAPRIGILADVQYGDKPTRGARNYRKSIDRLADCVRAMNASKPDLVMHLGDIIDGYADSRARSLVDLDAVLTAFKKLRAPVYHVIGNHCLTAGREKLLQRLGLKRAYYDFTHPKDAGWRLVVLDGNDAGYGVLGPKQLAWFGQTLRRAGAAGEKVIVANHFALLKAAAKHHRMKTPAPVLKVLDASPCVAAYITGHDHAGGFAVRRGVHHVTFKGMVEAPKHNAFAIMNLHTDHLGVVGYGKEPSGRLVRTADRAAAGGGALAWDVTIGQAGRFAVELNCAAAGVYHVTVGGKTISVKAVPDTTGQGATSKGSSGRVAFDRPGAVRLKLTAPNGGGDLRTVRALRLVPILR